MHAELHGYVVIRGKTNRRVAMARHVGRCPHVVVPVRYDLVVGGVG
jgi:hypothetical protein